MDDTQTPSLLAVLEHRARVAGWSVRRDGVHVVVERDGRALTAAKVRDVDQMASSPPGARVWISSQVELAGRGPVLVTQREAATDPVVDGVRALTVTWCPGRACSSAHAAGVDVPQACPGHLDWRLNDQRTLAEVWDALLTGHLVEHTIVPVTPLLPATFFATPADLRAAEAHEREAANVRATNQRRVADVTARAHHAAAATARRRDIADRVARHYAHTLGTRLHVGAELPELAHGVALTDEGNSLAALVEPDAHRLHRAAAGRIGTMTVWMATDQGAADIKNRTRRAEVWSLHSSALRAGCDCG